MTNEEIEIYLAGLFDGEGSLCIWRNNCGNYCLRLDISNTFFPVIELLTKHFQGGRIRHNKRQGKKQNCYSWVVDKKEDIINFLNCVFPYLIIKKRQASIALSFLETIGQSGRVLSREQKQKRRQLYGEMKLLNHGKCNNDE